MKLIVEYEEQKKVNLLHYSPQIEQFGQDFAYVQLSKRHLNQLNSLIKGVEENSIIHLKEQGPNPDSLFTEADDVILAFIGHKQTHPQVTHYYNINVNRMKPVNCNHRSNHSKPNNKKYYISCFSENNTTDTIGIVRCIKYLSNLSEEYDMPLVIYLSIGELRGKYKPRRLFYPIINQYLEKIKGILVINSQQENERYSDTASKGVHTNHLSCIMEGTNDINKDIRKALSALKSFADKSRLPIHECTKSNIKYSDNRQPGTLFSDPFYLSIDPNEEIYVPLLAEAYGDPQYYESLGFQHILLESGLRILYGRRSEFDRLRGYLRGVGGEFRLIIITHPPCIRDNNNPMLPYYLPPETQRYTGRGVYIAIITADDIDYTNPVLRNPDGSTRIAYIWEQVRTTEGNVYTSEQINTALASPNPSEIVRLPTGESMSTVMAAISGGWSEALGYRGIAPQAEFIIAKIRPVSENLQRVYGGMPSPTAITMFDALIGLLELGKYAINQGRPLSLIYPFNGNLDSHDAALYTQQEVSRLTKCVGLTIIVPAGDEANKRHHFEIQGEQEGRRIINLVVEQPNQNVVVVVYQRGGNVRSMNLYAPGTNDLINLKQSGMSVSGRTTIYSSGSNISFLNGTIRTLFRLENPSVGTWRMELDVKMGVTSRIQMWMSQEELNPYVRFNPNNALTTMGATAAIPYVMSVGGYDFNTQTVLSMSGRGDPQSSNIIPMLVTYGKSILAPCQLGEWSGVTGMIPAASIMAGVAAVVYQKYIEEAPNRIPNTVVMNSLILNVLIQIQTLQYPNPNQGYGMFTLETLLQLLLETV